MKRTVALAAAGLALTFAGVGFATTASTSTNGASVLAPESESARPQLILVKFHADWCPLCGQLEKPFDASASELATEDILFVRLDRTDKKTSHQSKLHMQTLGLGKYWDEYSKKNGQMVLFNGHTGEVVKAYTVRNSSDVTRELRAELKG